MGKYFFSQNFGNGTDTRVAQNVLFVFLMPFGFGERRRLSYVSDALVFHCHCQIQIDSRLILAETADSLYEVIFDSQRLENGDDEPTTMYRKNVPLFIF